MSWITNRYTQTATYWGNPIPDSYGGFTFDSPITLSVRWEERTESFPDPSGKVILSKALVFVDQDLSVGGYLYLGTSDELNPNSVKDAFRIQRMHKIPTVRTNDYLRIAFL